MDSRVVAIVGLFALATSGCGDAFAAPNDGGAGRENEAGAAVADAGGFGLLDAETNIPGRDGAVSDASASGNGGDGGDGQTPHEGDPTDGLASCSNLTDDDQNDVADCEEASCAQAPICCVGATSGACCTTQSQTLARLDACTGEALRCLAWADAPAAFVAGNGAGWTDSLCDAPGIVPGGSETSDGYLVERDAFFPRTAERSYELTLASDGSSSELSAATAGFFLDGLAQEPYLSVSLSGGRVSVAFGGDPVFEMPHEGSCARLSVLVSAGANGVRVGPPDASPWFETSALPPTSLYFGVIGRRAEGAPLTGVVRLGRRLADCPRIAPSPPSTPAATAVGAAHFDGLAAYDEELAVIAYDGTLQLTTTTGATLSVESFRPLSVEGPTLRDIQDPSIVITGSTRTLYFSAVEGSMRAIYTATIDTANVDGMRVRITPTQLPLDGTFDEPFAYARHGATELIARDANGALVRFELETRNGVVVSGSPAAAEHLDTSGELAATVYTRRAGTLEFDADEIADPFVVVGSDDLIYVVYAGRRGTRWSIGLLASADGEHFLQPAGGNPLLRPIDVTPTLDSARRPALTGLGGELRLWFVGADGPSESIWQATQALPRALAILDLRGSSS